MKQDGSDNRSQDPTWEQLVEAEPRLASLLEEVRAARPDDGDEYELEGVWGQFKDKIAGLVGASASLIETKSMIQRSEDFRTRSLPFLKGLSTSLFGWP